MKSREIFPCELPCPKCGSADIHREFHRKGDRLDLSREEFEKKRTNKFIRVADDAWERSDYIRDCISHHCRTCQYEWETEPMSIKSDAKSRCNKNRRCHS